MRARHHTGSPPRLQRNHCRGRGKDALGEDLSRSAEHRVDGRQFVNRNVTADAMASRCHNGRWQFGLADRTNLAMTPGVERASGGRVEGTRRTTLQHDPLLFVARISDWDSGE